MRKSAFLRAMYEQINTVRRRTQTGSGFFCNSDVKKNPNAIALRETSPVLTSWFSKEYKLEIQMQSNKYEAIRVFSKQ